MESNLNENTKLWGGRTIIGRFSSPTVASNIESELYLISLLAEVNYPVTPK